MFLAFPVGVETPEEPAGRAPAFFGPPEDWGGERGRGTAEDEDPADDEDEDVEEVFVFRFSSASAARMMA